MNIYRMLGALLLSLSGALMTYRLNRRAADKLRRAEALCELLSFIRAEVDCFSLPISEILKRADKQTLKDSGYQARCTPHTLWEVYRGIHWQDKQSEKLFHRFCTEFGRGFRDEQVSRCTYFLAQLEEHKRTLERELPSKKKLNSTLCMSGSLALLIFFL